MDHQSTETSVTNLLATSGLTDRDPSSRLSGQDVTALLSLGVVTLIVLSALSRIDIFQAIIAAIIFVTLALIYLKISRPPNISQNSAERHMTPRRAAYIGEARLADGFAEAVIIIGPQRRIEYFNPAAEALLGITIPGEPLARFVRNPAVIEIINKAMNDEQPDAVIYHNETPVDKHFRTLASPIVSTFKSETRKRVLIVFYDITDIVRSNDLRSDFLANASHELKTPVASLLGYIETLRGHAKDDPDARDLFLGIMQEQAERIQRLIDDLLSLRRIELSEHIAPTETADIGLAVKAAMEAVQPLAKARSVKLTYQGPKMVPVRGMQDSLVQVVVNLVDNAVQISPPKANITINIDILDPWLPGREFQAERMTEKSLRRRICVPEIKTSHAVRLRVRDTGIGFEREHLPRIGERFYRVAGDRKNKDRGTGLGLAIVKHIALRHRAGLYVETALGVGTEFTIILQPCTDHLGASKD